LKNKIEETKIDDEEETAPQPIIEAPKTTKNVLLFESIKNELPTLVEKENSRKTYKSSLQRLENLTNEKNVIKLFNEPDLLLDKIDTIESVNTRKTTIQTILKIKEWFNLPQLVTAFIEKCKQLDAESREKTSVRNEEEFILSYPEYLKIVLDKTEKYSKIQCIARLFNEVPVRDNFQLKILKQYDPQVNGNENVLLIKETKVSSQIYINKSKTAEKYRDFWENGLTLSLGLSNYLRKYMNVNKIIESGYLLGTSLQSAFILKQNMRLGISGGIDLMRRMKVKEIDRLSLNEKVKWAQIMGHDFQTQQNHYLSKK
jgi:hypothetical protein